ncbi:4-hydroxy-tetrahydrodipicolinate reductase 1, chloroplastic-like isoform X2 [Telopea speciosissima]|uniref:4-hydroxy-tetrahydrodipicolinate reductase 1, chloroplastic-like isoform X2 n=1 Tax=Telopea speciosissima TaxID=54955 RepID=UPI001CC66EE6|nr:4-hydroxy-tetrahydrodipicolinate reductase 1, chloroplastic-like isoform X2 [Telopea speciosissima]
MGFVLKASATLWRQENVVSFSQSPGRNSITLRKRRLPMHICSMSNAAAKQNLGFPILVNGCTGKMGVAVIEAAVSAGIQLVPASFSTSMETGQIVQVGGQNIQVFGPSEREGVLVSIFDEHPNLVVVDYTVPDAVNDNAELYCKVGVPFVMGTTGGDRERLYKTVEDSNVYAVISPQMGKQVVAFLAAMEIMADQFPGAFSGYSLEASCEGEGDWLEDANNLNIKRGRGSKCHFKGGNGVSSGRQIGYIWNCQGCCFMLSETWCLF